MELGREHDLIRYRRRSPWPAAGSGRNTDYAAGALRMGGGWRAAATVGSHREVARTTSTRRGVAGAVQVRLKTDFTGEHNVRR